MRTIREKCLKRLVRGVIILKVEKHYHRNGQQGQFTDITETEIEPATLG